ncbi:HHIP-like protein 2 [Acropora millepora]|uniref:HHIP-like protein 2 n=1 Tax=Acropora millepora TaxID=45264 RepID=UPI001CF1AE9F|nr:HHIP-like protein 2 [Acropora millepora]
MDTMPAGGRFFVALWGIVLFFKQLHSVDSHPQCLDYRAPFQVASGLLFCSQNYSDYGCCTSNRDKGIADLAEKFTKRFSLHTRPKCANMVRTILCLECHKYAAHIFAAEGNENFDHTTAAPGLCPDFCKAFYLSCRDVALEFPSLANWKLSPSSSNHSIPLSEEDFCDGLKLQDMDYCYPNVERVDTNFTAQKYNFDFNKGRLCVEEIARGLRNPLAAVHAGDGSGRMFIAEQIGVIHIIAASGKLLKQPFLDITDRVLSSGSFGDERGFLSIAFHPKFAKNRRFFVYYFTRLRRLRNMSTPREPFLASEGRTVLSEFKVSKYFPNRALRRYEQVILEVNQPADNHNGGMIFFGTDGLLYLTLGDGGRAGDPFGDIGNGLNRSTLLGSIIRINVDARRYRYKIPRDNPFVGIPGIRAEIYAYGIRNMWRCSMDRGDTRTGEGRGRIFCGDVGQNRHEEIDIIVKGGNYGWRGYEGFECYDKSLCHSPLLRDAIPPIFAYNHSFGKSIVGGYVYRGCQNPNLNGKYILGDTMTSRIVALTENKASGVWKAEEILFGDSKYCTDKLSGEFAPYILSFGEDEQGELYILSASIPSSTKPSGKVYRVVDPGRRGDPSECLTKGRNPSCEDKGSNRLCKRYLSRHKCYRYKSYLSEMCKKTCGFC